MSDLHTLTLIRELKNWRKRLERKLFAEGLERLEVAHLDFLNDRLGVQDES